MKCNNAFITKLTKSLRNHESLTFLWLRWNCDEPSTEALENLSRLASIETLCIDAEDIDTRGGEVESWASHHARLRPYLARLPCLNRLFFTNDYKMYIHYNFRYIVKILEDRFIKDEKILNDCAFAYFKDLPALESLNFYHTTFSAEEINGVRQPRKDEFQGVEGFDGNEVMLRP
ncbi:hypothetical protein NPX13_g5379 [Xylaria arbuscula]|uniref:FBD domain-containing protein n=1 Tax=Xylaria arbuscula TaxID=114810 RepID=A0A9W8NDS3_9PEZI|nr:hypothetical protein NPX13_g5379 [Xylaria arbuscula]